MKPFIYLNIAISLDGKITTADRKLHGFGGIEDRAMMEVLRDRADAVMIGGGTLREEDPQLILREPARITARVAVGKSKQPMSVIVSPSFDLPEPSTSKFFQNQDVTRLIFTAPGHDAKKLDAVRAFAEVIEIEKNATGLNLSLIVDQLAARGVQQLLLEGGGGLNFAMLEADLIDELNLTLCPLVFGGDKAPTAFGGAGFAATLIRAFKLVSVTHGADDRLFLKYHTQRN